MNELREMLAGLAHDQWSGWMKHLFNKSSVNEDGSLLIPAQDAKRWARQMTTPFADLSEAEQDSDRAEADKFIAVIREYLPAGIDPVPKGDEA